MVYSVERTVVSEVCIEAETSLEGCITYTLCTRTAICTNLLQSNDAVIGIPSRLVYRIGVVNGLVVRVEEVETEVAEEVVEEPTEVAEEVTEEPATEEETPVEETPAVEEVSPRAKDLDISTY